MRPVCVKCGLSMKCEKNDFRLEQFDEKEKKHGYSKWSADKYKCTECGFEVVVDFGKEPLSVQHEEGYKDIKVDLKFY